MDANHKITRRGFLKAAGGAVAAAAALPLFRTLRQWVPAEKQITGSIVGASHNIGHLLRSAPPSAAPESTTRTKIVIVGGGIAGLSAAWKLHKSGFKDFVVLELEPELGGNSRSGGNSVTPYPWGAHYVPLPDKSMTDVCEILRDLNVIKESDSRGEPVFDERYLCFAPQERLFLHGRWQDDLFPGLGATSADMNQYKAFVSAMMTFKNRRGRDGKKAFAIPVDESSQDADLLALDKISMEDYVRGNGWTSRRLAWYVDYACRDDFGLLAKDTSAWAGIHYWASRPTAFAINDHTVLTWPEGNGWIVHQLKQKLDPYCRKGILVTNVSQNSSDVTVEALDVSSGKPLRIRADEIILACPQFVAGRLLSDWRKIRPEHLDDFTYAPWMVANLSVTGWNEGTGAPLAWDNVLYDSESLGYVVATHQSLASVGQRSTVLTYYYPLAHGRPVDVRNKMLARTWNDWKKIVLEDLRKAHPEVEDHVSHMDVMLWGHGMVRPTPGFMWGASRRQAGQSRGRVHFANSDLSGISIFEEAVHQGFRAARRVLAKA